MKHYPIYKTIYQFMMSYTELYRVCTVIQLFFHKFSLVEKSSLVGRPKSTIVPVPLKTGTKNDF